MRTEQAPVIRLKDYSPSAYAIKAVDLDFSLEPEATKVRSVMSVERGKDTPKDAPLVLNGDELELVSLSVNGKQVPPADFKATPDGLTLMAGSLSPLAINMALLKNMSYDPRRDLTAIAGSTLVGQRSRRCDHGGRNAGHAGPDVRA